MSELNDILELATFFSSAFSKSIAKLANKTLHDASPSKAHTAWVIGSCLQILAGSGTSEWVDDVDIPAWTDAVTKSWAWSAEALVGLVNISPLFSR